MLGWGTKDVRGAEPPNSEGTEAETPKASTAWTIGVSSLQPIWKYGEHRELAQRGPGVARAHRFIVISGI